MGPIGTVFFLVGAISFLIGLFLPLAGISSRGSMESGVNTASSQVLFGSFSWLSGWS
jgi:hypothetical protein